ncbi:hypothetical protein, partial [Escherichia coli]|uniref:hypothetical protein n=1 Tax=Escherichia coli TaxID=562 RepID=UPI00148524D3
MQTNPGQTGDNHLLSGFSSPGRTTCGGIQENQSYQAIHVNPNNGDNVGERSGMKEEKKKKKKIKKKKKGKKKKKK